MTRSNIHLVLSNGRKIKSVADSSSAPEQGYIVEALIQRLLSRNNAASELKLIKEHCTISDQRLNAIYRYEINLITKRVAFYEEQYHSGVDRFIRGNDITKRYDAYLQLLKL